MSGEKDFYFEEKWLDKKAVRLILLVIVQFGSIGLPMLYPFIQQKWLKFLLFVFLVAVIILGIYLNMRYAGVDMKNKKRLELFSKNTESYMRLSNAIAEIIRSDSSYVNKLANEISKKADINEVIDEGIWSLDECSQSVCRQIFKLLQNDMAEGDDVEVSYVKVVDDGKEDSVKTIAFANKNNDPPHNFSKVRKINDPAAHFDCKMFRSGEQNTVICKTSEVVDNLLQYSDRGKENGKYSQMIAIPTFCDSNKMVGLLQVFVRKGSMLARDEDDMEKIRKKLDVFRYYLVLMQKVEKASFAFPGERIRE